MPNTSPLSALRDDVRAHLYRDEEDAVRSLLADLRSHPDPEQRTAVLGVAKALVQRCRDRASHAGTLDAFLREFGLSNPEGVALMCLAEALLRVPDDETADKLISEQIRSGNWSRHLGRSDSLFVNGSIWGLMLTGRLVALDPDLDVDPASWVERLVQRLGEPLVRGAIMQAMRILGRQFVLGRTIEEALKVRQPDAGRGVLYSFDMLGEGARTWHDAQRYLDAYHHAIRTIGSQASSDDPRQNDGISVKLSALHPRYEPARHDDVVDELLPRLVALAEHARDHALGFSIDAEEAARLDLSLTLFEALARDPALAGWEGLGFVLQAYQKRAPMVADWLIELAHQTGRRLMVRLVKGAYWDAEIKRAQELGLPDYPVFTRKSGTDLCYELCASRLLAANAHIYPQFATHNAFTLAQVEALGRGRDFELQRLHGMGELLYEEHAKGGGNPSAQLRVYAPVGSHQDLLPYLVRRLLENGANSSFVNRFLNDQIPVEEFVMDPLTRASGRESHRHPKIPLPIAAYRFQGEPRDAATGADLDDPLLWQAMHRALEAAKGVSYRAAPTTAAAQTETRWRQVASPADPRLIVGEVRDAVAADVELALDQAMDSQPAWNALVGADRAARLDRLAELLEAHRSELMYLIGAEAGRTVADALAEVREAVDFCRYYALQCRQRFAEPLQLPGPTGEHNELSLHGRGTFVCISPWNFPLAIFTGQIAAALAAGNSVIAKPAEQTPLIAAKAVALMHDAGIPQGNLHLLPGPGPELGKLLLSDSRVHGVAFTGSTTTALAINRQLATREGPIAPLIAETGGQNVLIADSTALPEQLVDDVLDSSFRSAGQRCSALRVLYLQEDIAEPVLAMLRGAMAALTIGNPLDPTTDVGPVIDEAARSMLQRHVDELASSASLIGRCELPSSCERGWFFPPQAHEIGSISELTGEVFGPVLHVVRYAASDLDRVLDDINGTGYGLTLGVHSRIDGFARRVFAATRVGNTYVNRNMIGAVVGVQPFGGQGLSGTGPKAGGPNYLQRFATERTYTDNSAARGGNAALLELSAND